jgi:ElaB/YqjD/DUF883 family membrane-anchored ribosome-binding protein
VSEKNGSAAGAKPDAAALRAEIKQTRAELGETVQALAAKADVKARAKESVEQTKAKVKAQVAEATGKATDAVRSVARGGAAQAGEAGAQVKRNPVPLAAVLAGVVAVVGLILIVRGRRR